MSAPLGSRPPAPSRRSFLGLAGVLGIGGLSACATSGAPAGAGAGSSDGGAGSAPTSPENPFGLGDGERTAVVCDGGGGVPPLGRPEELFLEKHPGITT